jgi:DNA-directed RNA polymerase
MLGAMVRKEGVSVQAVAKNISARLKNLCGGAEPHKRLGYEQAALVLLDYFMHATGWLEESTGERRFASVTRTPNTIALTDKFLEDASEESLATFAERKPMLVPPVPWSTGMAHGGCLYNHVQAVRGVRKAIEGQDIVSALNALQGTAWRVNARVKEVAERFERESLSSHIEGYGTVEVRHDAPAETRSNMIRSALTLDAFAELADAEAFYFPWNLDWRGRMYPATTIVSPQGSDLCKGLLEFSEGVPLGREGVRWLAINLCNLYGADKLTVDGRKVNRTPEEREEWTRENDVMIRSVATDPYSNTNWLDADKPYQFLAACIEWNEFTYQGAGFRSRLAGALDGSCSGVQMLSGMTRDESAGAMVNLTPTERGDDYYGRMAEALTRRLCTSVAGAGAELMEHLRFWSTKTIDRDLLKAPSMTKVYSAGAFTFGEQVQAKTGAPEGECLWLANQINACFTEVAPGMLGAMAYLQAVTDVLTECGKPLQWTTPAGLVVTQERFNEESVRIDTSVLGVRKSRTFYYTLDTLSKRGQRAGVSPNFVHGVDAAHMVRTVNALYRKGVRNFWMIHDSFGAPFAQCGEVFNSTREEFVELMSTDLLANWTAEVTADLPAKAKEKLPELPKYGSLNLNNVRDSLFAWF